MIASTALPHTSAKSPGSASAVHTRMKARVRREAKTRPIVVVEASGSALRLAPRHAPNKFDLFSSPIADAHNLSIQGRPSPYPTGILNLGAIDQLPPLPPHMLLSRPTPAMGDSAQRLFKVQKWLEICQGERHLDEEAYVTESLIREQAAFIIGFCA